MFVQEPGTEELRQKLRRLTAEQKIICTLSALEVRSAIRRRMRSGDLLESDGTAALSALGRLLSGMTPIELSADLVTSASSLIDRYRLKALDALQLACCLLYAAESPEPIVFVASDTFLLDAARRESLITWNPERPAGE